MAISRYGPRVLRVTTALINDLKRRGQLIEGPHVAQFEAAFGARIGGLHAISASYGRVAFYYILKAMHLPAGGEVIFPALTFWVMPEIARIAGLKPVFVDVDPATFNMNVTAFEAAITPETVAVVPTHLWGLPCDMDEIAAIASRHGLRVVEDCAHALGALYRGRSVGTFGDAAIFSFQTIKPLNTYGGGMAIARDPELAARIRTMADAEPWPPLERIKQRLWHGQVQRIATRPAIFKWTLFPLVYICTRLNWSLDMYFWEAIRPLDPMPEDYHERYTNVQAALGLEGLRALDAWTARTQAHARRMSDHLRGVPEVRVPVVPDDRTHAYYQYCAYVPDRDKIVDRCLSRGIDLETLHVDVCSELPIFGSGHRPTPGADEATGTVQIPVYELLTDAQIDRVAAVTRDAVLAQLASRSGAASRHGAA